MFIFDVDILTTSNRGIFPGIVAILFLFGPALAGFTYCTSFGFKSASMCNVFVIASGFLIGMGGTIGLLFIFDTRGSSSILPCSFSCRIGPLTCVVLELLARDPRNPNPNLSFVADILTWVLRFTPPFCLGKGLFYAINIELFQFLEGDESLSAWSEPILLYEVYFLLGQCIFYVLLAIQLDKWSTKYVQVFAEEVRRWPLSICAYLIPVLSQSNRNVHLAPNCHRCNSAVAYVETRSN
jgi:hypothetical protein